MNPIENLVKDSENILGVKCHEDSRKDHPILDVQAADRESSPVCSRIRTFAIEELVSSWSKDKYMLLKEDTGKSFLVSCIKALSMVLEDCKDKAEFLVRMKKEGWNVIWKDGRKNLTFIDEEGNKVRDTNLSKTFQTNICKEMLEKQFAINAECEKYYEEVGKEIDPEKSDSGEKKSVLKQLREYKKTVSKHPQKAKKHHRDLER